MTMTVLKRGSTGKSVKALQILLSGYGYDPNGIDGVFGPGCESVVKRYQFANGLDTDGCVGPLTWGRALRKILCKYKFDSDRNIGCKPRIYEENHGIILSVLAVLPSEYTGLKPTV